MSIRFSIPGVPDPDRRDVPSGTEPFEDALFRVTVKDAALVTPTRAAAALVLEAAEDDVVELTFDDGIVFYVPAAALRDDVAPAASRGALSTVPLPARLAFGAQTRGLGDWALKAVRVFGVRTAADLAVGALVAHIEGKLSQLGPGPGLYRCPSPGALGPAAGGQLPGDGPLLVFLHGTASSTSGSFGGLAEPDNEPLWREVQALHGGRVFALEHRTLSESPVENALFLAERLPAGGRVRLVSHSRGGLVGELLCRRGFDAKDLAQFADRPDEKQRLERLGRLLSEKQVTIERFVRVACPARGTTLGSRRLDRYLSLLLNAIGLIPALATSPLYAYVKSLLLAIAKKRADPEDLPGLEAQMPESRLVKILNRQDPGSALAADLSVIAGDIEGSGVWRRLAVLATDLFFRADHDLVVNTWAMTGGGRRTVEADARYAFAAGPEVSHFTYFRNARTAGKLLAALRGGAAREQAFTPLPIKEERLVERAAPRPGARPRPALFLLPGMMASRLAAAGERIWLDLDRLAEGKLDRLAAGEPAQLDGLMPEYHDIARFLDDSHDVIPFPFDWRLSVFDAAEPLAAAVAERLATSDQPVRFLAHAMGGLVVRALQAAHPEVWSAAASRQGMRFVMLGTPNLGSYAIPHLLLGRERVFGHLTVLDLTHGRAAIARLLGELPGLLDMLPVDSQANVFSAAWWAPVAAAAEEDWPTPGPTLLAAAHANRLRLDARGQPDPRHAIFVAGIAPETPSGIRAVDDGGRPRLELRGTARGDGRVTWAAGIPAGVPAWYMQAEHGRLACHPPAFAALRELLESGTTDRLSRQPPATRSGEETFPLAERGIDLFPDNEELAAAALGFEPGAAAPERPKLAVQVVLGDLRNARYPVMVGHYRDDGIYSAEAVLDRRLEGRLSRRHALGMYPGELGTSEVILDAGCAPCGVVAGLGMVGELTPGRLAQTVAAATLRYAVACAEHARADPAEAGISTVPIGSSEGGVGLHDAISAILRGVALANAKLAEDGDDNVRPIARVELVELFEDVAVSAAQVLADLARRNVIQGTDLEAAPDVRRVEGARRRIPGLPDQTWWRRLQITSGKDGTLAFTSLTDRARAEERQQPTERRIARRLVERAVGQVAWDPKGAFTLFSLLVPLEVREYAPDERSVVLVLDEETAAIPWELLSDDPEGRRDPFAVRAGVVRQLRRTTFRRQPVAAGGSGALVVGDPPSHLPALPGAQAEAREVAALLSSALDPVHLDRPTPEALLDALFGRPYQVLHLAGHGDLRAAGGSGAHEAGMVLAEGLRLSAREIRNLAAVPDLVVVNCCHLGVTDLGPTLHLERPPLFAASLAAELIDIGVRAVVAAGWAVDDAAARTFSLRLYERLLAGATFGEAVCDARGSAYRSHRHVNTWGAYQCYGDPGFRLRLDRSSRKRPEPCFVDPCEAVIELENLVSGARGGSLARQRVELVLRAATRWRDHAGVAAAAARALAAADDPEEAAVWSFDALMADRGELPLEDVERLISTVKGKAWPDQGNTATAGQLADLGKRHAALAAQLAKAGKALDPAPPTSGGRPAPQRRKRPARPA